MVKIIDRKSLNLQPVYDIGVEKNHNFVLANGLVASNCFNKSHSTAYAYVTYQTAYLKANYPVEYMAALLTASSDNKEKIEKYRENCQRMNIEVLPPDINRSNLEFTPIGKQILFGLSAIAGLGEKAIENILRAREESEEKFTSLADFCSRIDLEAVKKSPIENLILVGAFDCINCNRHQLINDLEITINWAKKRAKDKESGQMNLFDLLGGNNSDKTSQEKNFDQAPSTTPVEDYSLVEKLKKEKELLGFYISEHPLTSIQKSTQILSPINISELSEQKSRKKVSTIVILNSVKKINTKQGKAMAFLSIEDISGEAEAVVFPDTYEKIQHCLIEDAHLIIWGKIERKEDNKNQIIVDDAEPIEKVNMVMIRLNLQEATDTLKQQNLKGILQEQSGDKNKAKIPVIGIVGSGEQRQLVRFGQNYWVQNEHTTVEALCHAGFSAYAMPLIVNS
ncbi:MAG: OB-fold nucleic acid binding domain-containing protein [Hydrococcus sp. Prado102]|jgi:DNA polymerase-3 subunit alpha|nr:OB-fold nucleic acid binding domain-containing protein [Hydrococcus sp. Prado102]